MRVTVRLFAWLREIAGTGDLARDVAPGAAAADLWRALQDEFPGMAPYAGSVSVAVNAEYARMDASLADGDEVAFLPPVSGG